MRSFSEFRVSILCGVIKISWWLIWYKSYLDRLKIYWRWRHSILESGYVGFVSLRGWFQKWNWFPSELPLKCPKMEKFYFRFLGFFKINHVIFIWNAPRVFVRNTLFENIFHMHWCNLKQGWKLYFLYDLSNRYIDCLLKYIAWHNQLLRAHLVVLESFCPGIFFTI